MTTELVYIVSFATALMFSLAMVPPILRFAGAFQLFDTPDHHAGNSEVGRKVHSKPIPRLGGIAIVISFFLTQMIWIKNSSMQGVYVGAASIFLIGLLDDIISVKAATKFTLQVVIAAATVHYCDLAPSQILIFPNKIFTLWEPAALFLGTFIVVGAINTLNMIDGLDGLAGGIALIGITLLCYLYLISDRHLGTLLLLACPLVGSILGFLRYNTHPAIIFMGDGGSNWLGFMLGVMMLLLLSMNTSTVGLHGSGQVIPLISVICCLAIPILDTASVMLGRWKRGVSPMSADRTHMHHALLRIGLSHAQTVSALYFLALAIGVMGVLPVAFPGYNLDIAPYIGLTIVILFVLGTSKLEDNSTINLIKRRDNIRKTATYSWISRGIRYWESINRYALYLIFIAGPAFAGVVRPTMGYAAIAVACLLASSIVASMIRRSQDFIDAACLALAAMVLLIVNNSNLMSIEWLGNRVSIQPIYNALFGFLAISTLALFIVTAKKRYLLVKPSDFLFLTIPLVLLLIPEPMRSEYKINVISLRSIIIFASVRTLASRSGHVLTKIKGVALAALIFVYLAGVYGLKIVY